MGPTHTLTRQLADPPLMNLTVLQAILDHSLESACRSGVGILIDDVRRVLDESFPEDPIIVPLKSFLDLQPVQGFQILSLIQKAPQVCLGCKVDAQFVRGARTQKSEKEVVIQLRDQRCQKLPQLGLQLVRQQLGFN